MNTELLVNGTEIEVGFKFIKILHNEMIKSYGIELSYKEAVELSGVCSPYLKYLARILDITQVKIHNFSICLN